MKTTNDLPLDPLGTLGPAIKPATPATPDPVRVFEQQTDRPLIADQSKAVQTIADTLRKKQEATLEWEPGMDLNAVMAVTHWGYGSLQEE